MPCTAPALREPSYTSAQSLADPRFQGQWWILGLALTSMLFNYILGEGLRFDLKTKASPEQVLRALTDFTDARLQIWNRTLDPKTYELRDSGETWAVARESSRRSPFWVVVRYDWSDPESVRWTVLDSSYGGGGEGLVQIAPGDDGGSRVHAEWGYTGARGMQRPMIFLIQHGPVRRLIKRMWASALDRYAEISRR